MAGSATAQWKARSARRYPPPPKRLRSSKSNPGLTNGSGQNIIVEIRGSRRRVADIKSESRPASNRNRWPASYWNAWPASSESAGADGVGSAVRNQRLPGSDPQYAGTIGIFGRTRVGAVNLPRLQKFLDTGGILALGPHGRAFFCTTMRFRENPAQVAARLGLDVGPTSAEDYMMWAVALRQKRSDDLRAGSPDSATMIQIALRGIDGFDQDFRELIGNTEPSDTVLVPIRAMPHLKKWRPSRVTMIGDAIHTMPPFGAHGANTSLKDAQMLSSALAGSTHASLVRSIASYESNMRSYSDRAVRSALRLMKLATADFPFKKTILLAVLRVAGAFSR